MLANVVQTPEQKQRERDEKLRSLGLSIIHARISERKRHARDRAYANCVNMHLHASADELQERLREIEAKYDYNVSEAETNVEIDKLRAPRW